MKKVLSMVIMGIFITALYAGSALAFSGGVDENNGSDPQELKTLL